MNIVTLLLSALQVTSHNMRVNFGTVQCKTSRNSYDDNRKEGKIVPECLLHALRLHFFISNRQIHDTSSLLQELFLHCFPTATHTNLLSCLYVK